MSDAKVICGWMEPNPRSHTRSRDSSGGWWRLIGCERATGHWEPTRYLTLDALHEVEARLTPVQQFIYLGNLLQGQDPPSPMWFTTHATAEQKIKALAQVIR